MLREATAGVAALGIAAGLPAGTEAQQSTDQHKADCVTAALYSLGDNTKAGYPNGHEVIQAIDLVAVDEARYTDGSRIVDSTCDGVVERQTLSMNMISGDGKTFIPNSKLEVASSTNSAQVANIRQRLFARDKCRRFTQSVTELRAIDVQTGEELGRKDYPSDIARAKCTPSQKREGVNERKHGGHRKARPNDITKVIVRGGGVKIIVKGDGTRIIIKD